MSVLVSTLYAVHTVLSWRISLNAKQETEMEDETEIKLNSKQNEDNSNCI